MTVTEQTTRQVFDTDGQAADTEMNIIIPFYDTSDIVVEQEISGVTTTMVQGVDYTLTGGDGAGGTLTNLNVLPADSQWVVYRQMPVEQNVDLSNQGRLLPDKAEEGLDRLVLLLLDQVDGSNRSVKADDGEVNPTGLRMPDLATRASKILQWAADGEISAVDPGSVLPSEVTVSDFMKDTFLIEATALAAREELRIQYGANAQKSGTPTVGDIYFATDTLELYFCKSTNVWSLMSASQTTVTKPNLIINGSAKINQRVNCNPSATYPNNDFGFCLDHVLLVTDGASGTATVQQNTSEKPDGASHCFELTTTATGKKYGLLFPIDNVRCAPLLSSSADKVCSVRFKYKATSGVRNMQAGILAWDGTADALTDPFSDTAWGAENTRPTDQGSWTWESDPIGQGARFAVSTSWQTKELTNVAINLAGATNVALAIWVDDLDLVATTDKIYIAEVQLNEGSALAPYRPPHYREEEIECLRFYQKSFAQATMPQQNAGTNGMLLTISARNVAYDGGAPIYYQGSMFKVPTLTFYNPADTNTQWRNFGPTGAAANAGLPSTAYATAKSVIVKHPNTASGDMDVGDELGIHWDAVAEITA